MAEHRVPGLAIAVVRSGSLAWTRGYGYADKAAKRRVTADTVFNAGSISKPVAAWAVMRLVEAGAIDLDRPVRGYLPSWPLPAAESDLGTDGITMRRLLSHTAGLSMHSIPGFALDRPLPTLDSILSGDYEDSIYTDGGTSVRQIAAPGSAWQYSGGGFVLAQRVVDEVAGEPFAKFVGREVLQPLGMRASRYGWHEDLADTSAVPYRANGEPCPTYRFSGTAGAGLYTTVTDLGRFAAAAMPTDEAPAGRDVLRATTLAKMLEHTPLLDGSASRCGIGYFLQPAGRELREAFHGGSNFGWQAVFVSLPDRGAAIVILTNSNNSQPILPQLVCEWGEYEIGQTLSGCDG